MGHVIYTEYVHCIVLHTFLKTIYTSLLINSTHYGYYLSACCEEGGEIQRPVSHWRSLKATKTDTFHLPATPVLQLYIRRQWRAFSSTRGINASAKTATTPGNDSQIPQDRPVLGIKRKSRVEVDLPSQGEKSTALKHVLYCNPSSSESSPHAAREPDLTLIFPQLLERPVINSPIGSVKAPSGHSPSLSLAAASK